MESLRIVMAENPQPERVRAWDNNGLPILSRSRVFYFGYMISACFNSVA
jgi:hypothetical protein